MNRAVVVVAPEGAGKTKNASRIATALGCSRIVDDWNGKQPLQPGELALTNMPRDQVSGDYRVLGLDEALQAA